MAILVIDTTRRTVTDGRGRRYRPRDEADQLLALEAAAVLFDLAEGHDPAAPGGGAWPEDTGGAPCASLAPAAG